MSKFGWYQHTGKGYRFNLQLQSQRDFVKTTTIDNSKLHIKFGNDFGPDWIDHASVDNFYFYDNPELPHLINPNPANPKGNKDWIRLVPNGILTQHKTQRGSDRVNSILTDLVGKPTVWQDIVQPKPVQLAQSRKVLLCPSSYNCFVYYYNDTKTAWIDRTRTQLEQLGYEVVVREKPTRTLRNKDGKFRLAHQLEQQNILFTVSQHSVSALESILHGTPTVYTGIHPTGELGTPWEEMVSGNLRTPNPADVEDWMDWILGNTRHKQEMNRGVWHD